MFKNETKLLKKENDKIARWMDEDDVEIIDRIMESLGIFRVNSFDAEVIRRDLIGMAEEARLRDSNMKEVMDDDIRMTTYDIIRNSRGASKREIVLLYLKYLSGIIISTIGFFGFTMNRTIIWDVNIMSLISLALSTTMFFLIAKLVRPLLNMEGWGRFGYYWTFFTALSLSTPSLYAAVSSNFPENQKMYQLYIPNWYLLIAGIVFLISDYFYRKTINKLARDKGNYFEDLIEQENQNKIKTHKND